METVENLKHRDIDGGYAWIILFAAFMCHGVVNGSRQILGILNIEILDIYQAWKYRTYGSQHSKQLRSVSAVCSHFY